jgi:LPXTG-site transpeptidase (sortase) family protein
MDTNSFTTQKAPLRKDVFMLHTLVTMSLLSTFLFVIDFVPEQYTSAEEQSIVVTTEVDEKKSEQLALTDEAVTNTVNNSDEQHKDSNGLYSIPQRITIHAIGLDTSVIVPQATDIATLDEALLKGAVYYPGSGSLGENANVLIFAHSSYLPVIQNKAFKAFNELGKLTKGDAINIYTDTELYIYKVVEVRLTQASDVTVSFESETPILTLATCNSFGSKQERWVVSATFEKKEQIDK